MWSIIYVLQAVTKGGILPFHHDIVSHHRAVFMDVDTRQVSHVFFYFLGNLSSYSTRTDKKEANPDMEEELDKILRRLNTKQQLSIHNEIEAFHMLPVHIHHFVRNKNTQTQ